MPGALSQDLRKRVVDAYDNGEGSYVQLAERFGIGVATVKRWMWRRRDTGGLQPLFSNNGNKPVFTTPENLELLRQILLQEPDLTYEELAAAWSDATGMEIGRTTTVCGVRKPLFSLKKKSLRTLERDIPRIEGLQRSFERWQQGVDTSKLVFLDESGVTTAMTRTRARAPRGERVTDQVPRNRGCVTTLLGAMTTTGVTAMMAIEAGTSTDVFESFLRGVLGGRAPSNCSTSPSVRRCRTCHPR